MSSTAAYDDLISCCKDYSQRLLAKLDAMERNVAAVAALVPQLPPPPLEELRASLANLQLAIEELSKPCVDADRVAALNPFAEVPAFLIRSGQWLETVQQGQRSALS